MPSIYFYEVDEGKIIAVKKFTENSKQSIIFIDVETDGLKFSYTIKLNFNKKNIETFLKTKFKQWKEKI